MKTKLTVAAFILMALIQLYFPAQMIFENEHLLQAGIEYKFKTAPIDPNDPFRGKYITLHYEQNTIEIRDENEWQRSEVVYVIVSKDLSGFAKIQSVSKVKPSNKVDFVKAKVNFVTTNGSNKLIIGYPFDRYYMEESKAPEAEVTYRESQQDTRRPAYALVKIKGGEAVLEDVLIDGESIKEIVKKGKK